MLAQTARSQVDGNLALASPRARSKALPALSRAELLAHLSGAFDLAELQSPGHATRVAYIALTVAGRLDLDVETQQTVLYAGLLHDAGVAVRALPAGVDPKGGHTAAGAWVAARFGLDERTQQAIRHSHERWDGTGRPGGLSASQIPIESLIVAASHWACDASDTLDNLLLARAQLQREHATALMPLAGHRIAEAMREVLRADETWMALADPRLPEHVASFAQGEAAPAVALVDQAAVAMGEVVDAAAREPGRAARVAQLAVELARVAELPESELPAVSVAGHLLDIGLLGVPRHITEKPAILSVDEMEIMRRHPTWGARVIEDTPGLEFIAGWIDAHHERPDGRGYPEMLSREEIPLAARILAIADSYWALRAERPHRPAYTREDAVDIIEANAGEQFDGSVVEWLVPALDALERTPRRRRAS